MESVFSLKGFYLLCFLKVSSFWGWPLTQLWIIAYDTVNWALFSYWYVSAKARLINYYTSCNSIITFKEPELKPGKCLYVSMHWYFLIILLFYLLNSLRDWEKYFKKCIRFYSILWWHFHIYYKAIDHSIAYGVIVRHNSNSFLPLHFESNMHFYWYITVT